MDPFQPLRYVALGKTEPASDARESHTISSYAPLPCMRYWKSTPATVHRGTRHSPSEDPPQSIGGPATVHIGGLATIHRRTRYSPSEDPAPQD